MGDEDSMGDGEGIGDGEVIGDREGMDDGEVIGDREGMDDGEGIGDGEVIGDREGMDDGEVIGDREGINDGEVMGDEEMDKLWDYVLLDNETETDDQELEYLNALKVTFVERVHSLKETDLTTPEAFTGLQYAFRKHHRVRENMGLLLIWFFVGAYNLIWAPKFWDFFQYKN